MPFLDIALPILSRWGSRPEVCAIRLAIDLHAGGYVVVPRFPTEEMVRASCHALRRHGIGRDALLGDHHKHMLRLQDALQAGHHLVLRELA